LSSYFLLFSGTTKYDIYIIVFDIEDLKNMGEPNKMKFNELLEEKLFRLQFSISS